MDERRHKNLIPPGSGDGYTTPGPIGTNPLQRSKMKLPWRAAEALFLALGALATPHCVRAQDPAVIHERPQSGSLSEALQSYEPMTGGYTKDNDDVRYLDVNLSLKIQLLPVRNTRLFLAMSTRFGFYWGSRPGSPVIGKSYNPKLIWRFLLPENDVYGSPDGKSFAYTQYLDIAYAHQSNGQLVHTPEEYDRQLVATPPGQYTNNFIHRGWDYVEVVWKRRYGDNMCGSANDVSTYVDGKYFIPKGFLQGREDEYHSWEHNLQGKPRKSVDGIEAVAVYPSCSADLLTGSHGPLSRPNLTLKYLTGYHTPVKFSTVRAEFGFSVYKLPLALWVQDGYMSNLAMYYLKVRSYGLEVRFNSF